MLENIPEHPRYVFSSYFLSFSLLTKYGTYLDNPTTTTLPLPPYPNPQPASQDTTVADEEEEEEDSHCLASLARENTFSRVWYVFFLISLYVFTNRFFSQASYHP